MIRIPFIDIKKSFADFVEVFGGEVSDKLIKPLRNQPKNADYIFKKESVIAELKCLEEDLQSKEDFIEKRDALVDKWVNLNLVTAAQVEGPTIRTGEFPEECQRDLIKLYGRPIKSHIESANRQIRQSIKDHNIPTAKGLLLLAVDGNYSLEPKQILFILKRILNSKQLFPYINTVLVFSPNIPVQMHDGSIGPLWMHFWRDITNVIPIAFLNTLGYSWANFQGRLIGRPMTMESYINEEGLDPHNVVDNINFIKPPPSPQEEFWDECIHLRKKERVAFCKVTAQKAGVEFTLCKDCYVIWDADKQPNPADSQAYLMYRSTDKDLPRDQWTKLTEKPIHEPRYLDKTQVPGIHYYYYVVTVNALGLKSYPSEILDGGIKPINESEK